MGPVKRSLFLAWLSMSLIVLPVLIAPLVLPAETILRLEPVCEWKAKYNKECVLCGMSRAFIRIAQGEFSQAASLNRGSIPFYFGLVANELLVAWLVGKAAWSGRRPPRRAHGSP